MNIGTNDVAECSTPSHASEATWLTSALRFGGIGAWSWSVDQDILDYTDELETILGKRDGDQHWNYAAFLRAILEEDRERVDRAVQKCLVSGVTYRETFRFLRTDGHIRWAEGSGEMDVTKTLGSPVMNGILRDITHYKQHEAQFESIVEKTPNVAIQGYDLEGRVLFWNEASEWLFGWKAEQAIGKRLEEFLHTEEEAKVFRDTVRVILRSGEAHGPTEFSVNKADGSRTECLSTIFQIADGPTGPAFVCMDVDISTQKLLGEALQESTKRYTNLFHLSPDAIVLLDLHTREIIEISNGFERTFGVTSKQAVGCTITKLGLWGDVADRDRLVEHLKEGEVAGDFEAVMRRKSGEKMVCSISAKILTVGSRECIMAVARDITDRKKTELKVRESEEWFRTLIEFSSDLIHIISPDGKLLYESPSAQRVLGYDPDDELGGNVFELIHPDDHEVVTNALSQMVQFPELPGKAEFRVKTFDGTWLYFDARARNMIDQPGIGGIVVNSRNVTDRHYAEQRTLLQIERLKSLHTIDAAISGSLDLKVTLGVVLGELSRQLRSSGAVVRVLRPDSCMLEVAAEVAVREHGDVGPVHLGAGIAGRAVMEARVLQCEARFPGDEDSAGSLIHVAAPLIAKGRPNGVLEIWVEKEKIVDAEWFSFLEMLAGQTAIAIDNVLMFEEIQRSNMELVLAYDSTIEGWSKALELRDKETEGHTKRVTELSVHLARQMGFSESAIVQVRRGALLHDIGKMGVPDEILLKPDKLTKEEFDTMKKHTEYAFEWLSPIPFLREAIEIPYCHHEKWDGTGYPRGLKGEQIPLAARVFAVVDVFDALTVDRPYRVAMEVPEVLAYIDGQSGTHFDPRVVEAFLHLMRSTAQKCKMA